jgi:hypothetical protein
MGRGFEYNTPSQTAGRCRLSDSLNLRAGTTAVLDSNSRNSTDLVKRTILETTLEGVLECQSERPLAVLVSGSMARDEQTVLRIDGFLRVLGDAEFYLVFDRRAKARAFTSHVPSLVREIERRLVALGIRCPVSFATPTLKTLRQMLPHIMGYELRTTGKVVWGERAVLSSIPRFGSEEIPMWDSWRSVSNRMIEQLGQAEAFQACSKEETVELLYRCLKIQLELATLVTHFHDAFQPTYQQRAEAIRQLQARSVPASLLPWWPELAKRVEMATQFKLQKDDASLYTRVLSGRCGAEEATVLIRTECEEVLSLVRSVWFWGAERLLGRSLSNCDEPLRAGLAIAAAQSWRWRTRGWAHLLLLESRGRRMECLGRFLRLSRWGGPRFLSYAVAAALYFSWPDWARGNSHTADSVAAGAIDFFPMPGRSTTAKIGWLAASQLVFNGWHEHLEKNWA